MGNKQKEVKMTAYIKYINGEKTETIESFLSAEQNKWLYEIKEPGNSFYFEKAKKGSERHSRQSSVSDLDPGPIASKEIGALLV